MRRNRDESLSPYGKISMGEDVGTDRCTYYIVREPLLRACECNFYSTEGEVTLFHGNLIILRTKKVATRYR